MSISISQKGTDKRTGLQVDWKGSKIIWDREAECFFVMVQSSKTYPTGLKENTSLFRLIIQDTPEIMYAQGEVITPQVLSEDGVTVITPAVISDGTQVKTPANLAYTNFKSKYNLDGIGADIDAFILATPVSSVNQ